MSPEIPWTGPLCRRTPATATAVAKEKFSTVMDASSRAVDYLGDDHKKAMSEWRMLEPENNERTEDKKGPSNGSIVYVVILHLAGEGL